MPKTAPRIWLRDPVARISSLRQDGHAEPGRKVPWRELKCVYRELGGSGSEVSELHRHAQVFFNGQVRATLPADSAKRLKYWAGMPAAGAALRDEALALLKRGYRVEVDQSETHDSVDPETHSLILAYNQIDAELYAYFAGLAERWGPQVGRGSSGAQGRGVCVLGMSRSGTSLTARVLNLLGVDLGDDEELMAPRAGNNPAGFWEHKGIADLNEEILAVLSETPPPYLQGWRWPPALDPGWERDPRLDSLRRTAREFLDRDLAGGGPWGWKDPRNSLTLPFWQALVPDLRYVICVRHPLEVAASLLARDAMPREEALALWQRYMWAALEHTEGRPRIFVAYESYFSDWEHQAARLANFLDLPAPDQLDLAEIAVNVEPDLRHHRRPGDADDLPDAVAGLYARLAELCEV